ncbi:MAG: hypothetical protein ACOX6H_04270 [Christensenellales bacterium]|jgi:hypothetical protein
MTKYIRIKKLDAKRKEVFEKYFADEQGDFYFEGMWLRDQRKANANQSGWKDESTARRRYIHFYDKYVVEKVGEDSYLSIKDIYLTVTNTLPKDEIDEYKNKIFNALKSQNYKKEGDNFYTKSRIEVLLFDYENHPKNAETGATFPENYASFDVIIKTEGNQWQSHYNRMWEHSTKMYRLPDKRENPHYETDIKALKQFLPAQIEMGCGPSIEVGIPPLYEMHETYKVQNHETRKFYFSNQDDLVLSIILDHQKMYEKFAAVPVFCLEAKHSDAYKIFGKAYKQGHFIGTVYNNNFDRLVTRLDIPEIILRIYEKKTYLPKIKFDDGAKSLICIGCHADRRQVQKQAREQGLKVVFVDPEGFCENDKFVSYPIEGPQKEDIIYKMTFTEFMTKFENEFLK